MKSTKLKINNLAQNPMDPHLKLHPPDSIYNYTTGSEIHVFLSNNKIFSIMRSRLKIQAANGNN